LALLPILTLARMPIPPFSRLLIRAENRNLYAFQFGILEQLWIIELNLEIREGFRVDYTEKHE
jgi:hypothetical protein